jgi:hypothetical protein
MSILTKESDLLEFINQKRQPVIDVSDKRILTMYTRVLASTIVKPFDKIGIGTYAISCLETVSHLFWLLFSYSKNLKLTMFLCDRAVLLFNEYIVMTKSTIFGNNSMDAVNMSGVKTFVYKKTIGPISFGDSVGSTTITPSIQTSGRFIKLLYTTVASAFFRDSSTDSTPLSDTLDQMWTLLSEDILHYLKESNIDNFNTIIQLVEHSEFSKLTPIMMCNTLYLRCIAINKGLPICTEPLIELCRNKYKLKLVEGEHNEQLLGVLGNLV